jgi:tetratricopeptide (TPR) repeat protein
MPNEWYYSRDGHRQGPIADSRLKQLAAAGELLPTDLVWKQGLARWVPASKVRGLFAGKARVTGLERSPTGKPPAEATFTHHLVCGDLFVERASFEQAIAEYTEALRLDPKSSVAYCGRAAAYRKKGDLDRALVDCNLSLRFDPNLAAAYKERGNIHFERREWDQALADYTEALRREPAFMIVHYNCGLVHFNRGQYDPAIVEFTKAIELDANYAPAFGYRSLAHLKKGNFDQARLDCAEAMRLDPKFDL